MYWTICGSVITLVGLTGNILILAAVYHWKKLHVPSNVLFCFLGVADILTLPTALMLIVIQDFSLDVSTTTCSALYVMALVATALSSGYIQAITFERALAIFKPIFFRRCLSTRRTFLFAILIFVVFIPVSFVLAVTMKSNNKNCKTQNRITPSFVHTVTIMVGVLTLDIFIMYVAMFVKVSRRMSDMRRVSDTVFTVSRESNTANVQYTSRTNYRLLRVSALVISTSVLSWVPMVIFFNLVAYNTATVWPLYERFGEISRLCVMTNSALDPIIYGFMAKNVRMGIKRLFRCR